MQTEQSQRKRDSRRTRNKGKENGKPLGSSTELGSLALAPKLFALAPTISQAIVASGYWSRMFYTPFSYKD